MVDVLKAGPEGHTYPLVKPSQADIVIGCAKAYDVIDQSQSNLVVATSAPSGSVTMPLEAFLAIQRAAGRGLVVQMPDLKPAGFGSPGVDIFCAPPADFAVTVAVLATTSLTEARGMLTTPQSFVLAEPKSGWVETGRLSGLNISWGRLVAAAAVVSTLGYLVLKR